MTRFLVALALIGTLSACNTVAGVGRDLSAGGAAITGVSNDVRRPRPAPVPAPVQQPYYY